MMKNVFTVVGWVALILAILIGVGWLFAANTLGMRSFFAPKFEEVRRTTFETSKAYRDGMAQELRSLQIEYLKADPKIQPALATAIRHKAAGVPDDALPSDLAIWIRSLP